MIIAPVPDLPPSPGFSQFFRPAGFCLFPFLRQLPLALSLLRAGAPESFTSELPRKSQELGH